MVSLWPVPTVKGTGRVAPVPCH